MRRLFGALIAALFMLSGFASAPALAAPSPVSVAMADSDQAVSGAKYTVCTRLGSFSKQEIH